MDLTDQRLGFWQGVAATKCSMSGFDRYDWGFGRELRQQNVQCLDLTSQRLGFWQGVAATKCSMSGFDRSTIRVLAGVAATKCSMSGFDRSTIRFSGRELRQQNVQRLDLTDQRLGFLAGSCGNKMFNVWI